MNILLLRGSMYARALRSLGHRVFVFTPAQTLGPDGKQIRRYSFRNALDLCGFTPDLVLMELFGPRYFPEGFSECSFPTAAYVFDSSFNMFWLRHYLHLFDHVFVDFKDSLPRLAQEGIEAHWLPYAVDMQDIPEPAGERDIDIAFAGVQEERPRRKALLNLLQKHFHVHVIGGIKDKRVPFADVMALYARSKLVINEYLYPGLNFRIFEGMSAGAMMLTEETDNGLMDLFTPGKHLATFKSGNLIAHTSLLLKQEDLRRQIAENGRKLILDRHTRKHRAQEMLEILEGKPASRPRSSKSAANERRFQEGRTWYHFMRRWPEYRDSYLLQSENLLRSAAVQGSLNGPSVWTLAMMQADAEKWEQAYRLIKVAAKLLPDEPRIRFHRALILNRMQRPNHMRRAFDEGLQLCSGIQDTRITRFRELLSGTDTLPEEAWIELGLMYDETGYGWEPNEAWSQAPVLPLHADECYRIAFDRFQSLHACLELGKLYVRVNMPHLAWEALQVVLENPAWQNRTDLLIISAYTCFQMFMRMEGVGLLKQALEIDPALYSAAAEFDLTPSERELLRTS